MSSKFRLTLLLFIAATLVFSAAFGPSLQVNAQGDQCFGLSADDCALAKSAAEQGTLAKLTSFNMEYELTITASGPQSDNVDLALKGTGPFSVDAASMDSLNKGDVKNIDKLTMANTLSGSLTSKGEHMEGNFEFRIVNGTLYFQGDKATKGKWMSIDLQKAASAASANRPGLTVGRMNPLQALAMLAEIRKLVMTPGFITAERTGDTTVENQQIATFVYHFDLPKLLNSPEMVPFIKAVGSQNPRLQKLTDAQIKALAGMIAKVFQNSQFSVSRMIGVTDKLPHGFGIDVVVNIDPKDLAAMQAMMPSSSAPQGNADQPLKLNFHFLVKLTGIGSKVTVNAPEGATPVDLSAYGSVMPTPAR
jgi:hypothetical protein